MTLGHLGSSVDIEETNGLQELPSPVDQGLLNGRDGDDVTDD
jgi:hypothetical protein